MAIASVIAAEKAKNANGVSAPQPSLPSQTLTERLWLVGAADHHGHAAVSALSCVLSASLRSFASHLVASGESGAAPPPLPAFATHETAKSRNYSVGSSMLQ